MPTVIILDGAYLTDVSLKRMVRKNCTVGPVFIGHHKRELAKEFKDPEEAAAIVKQFQEWGAYKNMKILEELA